MLAANGVTVLIDSRDRYTPTPALSHAILRHNAAGRGRGRPTGSWSPRRTTRRATAASSTTRRTAARRTATSPAGSRTGPTSCSRDGLRGVGACRSRGPGRPTRPATYDFLGAYVDDLPSAIDLDAVREAGVRIGADPLGGASVDYWGEIAERHRLDLTVVNPLVDPTWRFMTLDWDGKIRMDCSSPVRDGVADRRGARSSRSRPATTPTPTGTAS